MAAGVGPPRSGALMAACSIIIPTHNRLALVHQAAASALAALFPGGGQRWPHLASRSGTG